MANKKVPSAPKGAPEQRTAETKARKFVELAQKRTTRAINSIRSIAKLANSNYVYTDAQSAKICEALKIEVQELHARFNRKTAAVKDGFML